MPTEGTRLQKRSQLGPRHAVETENGSTLREWWDAACGLLPAVVLAAGCFAGLQWWMARNQPFALPPSAPGPDRPDP